MSPTCSAPKSAAPRAMVRVVRNGVGEAEFEPVVVRPDATDLVCVGELRPVKAIDILIEALAILKQSGRRVTVTIAGEGPDGAQAQGPGRARSARRQVHFVGHCPARDGVHDGTHAGHAVARGIAALCRARGRRRRHADHRHCGRRRSGDFRRCRPTTSFRPTILPPLSALSARHSTIRRRRILSHRRSTRGCAAISRCNTMVDGGIAAYREALAMRKLAQFA